MRDRLPPSPAPTSLETAASQITRLAQQKNTWGQLSRGDRIHYLQACQEGVQKIAPNWVTAACAAKGIEPNSAAAWEEWASGPAAMLVNLNLLIQALAAGGQPSTPRYQRPDGQWVASVFPGSPMEQVLWPGFRGEIWIEPGKLPTQGRIYRAADHPSQVALVLGAGNISSIGPMDALYQLFACNRVVLLKCSPVNAYLGPFLEQAFAPLCQAGFLEIVYGGADLGHFLCHHPEIEAIHITGSHQTYDAIVWGATPEEQAQRKAASQPLLAKAITAELGCVTPVLVVPGPWTAADLAFQARHVAGMVSHNAGFNCTAAQVVITARGWPQRQAFLDHLALALANLPPRQAYYPQAEARYQSLCRYYPQAQVLAAPVKGALPWTLIPDVPPQAGEIALQQEAFCGLLAETSLEATAAADFLTQAVELANHHIWGNLSCTVLIDPQTARQHRSALDRAIANLRYGAIGLNVWAGVTYALAILPWGAFPGNPTDQIGSGHGAVHNAYLFDYPQKSVLHAPFRPWPAPIWAAGHRNALALARQLTEFYARPTWANCLQVIWQAIWG